MSQNTDADAALKVDLVALTVKSMKVILVGWVLTTLVMLPSSWVIMLGLSALHASWHAVPAWGYWTVYLLLVTVGVVRGLFQQRIYP